MIIARNFDQNAISPEQTIQVKGGISPKAAFAAGVAAYNIGKWGYDHRNEIKCAAKNTYNVGKKAVKWVSGWF